MSRGLCSMLTLLVVLVLAAGPAAATEETIVGTVAGFDAETSILTIATEDVDVDVKVLDTTLVKDADGNEVGVEDLALDTPVTVTAAEEDEQLVASLIQAS